MLENVNYDNQVLFIDCQNWLAKGRGLEAAKESRLAGKAIQSLWNRASDFVDLSFESHFLAYAKPGERGVLSFNYMGLQKLSIPPSISSVFSPFDLLDILGKKLRVPRAIIVSSQSRFTGYGVEICNELQQTVATSTGDKVRSIPVLPLYCYLARSRKEIDPNYNPSQLKAALDNPSFVEAFSRTVVYRPNDQVIVHAGSCLQTLQRKG